MELDQRQEIENYALEIFSELENFGFSQPFIQKRTDWATTIDWFHDKIALEIKLDWLEYSTVFVLLVRLENGELPKGFYVSKGKECRFYLERVIQDRGWSVDQVALQSIKDRANVNYRDRDAAKLRKCAEDYRKVIVSCVDQLVKDQDLIFD
jgi:hypothetical protein